jgi:diguanylate cyclase (GGDEF)-like protein/PAS domain S-box-containing protein
MTGKALAADSHLAQFESIFEHACWGLAIVCPNTNQLTYVNTIFAEMHGSIKSDMIGRDFSSLFAPNSLASLKAVIQSVSETGQCSYESIHLRKDGSSFNCESHVIAIKDDKGEVIYRAGTCVDITNRKALEISQSKLLVEANKLREDAEYSKDILHAVFERVNDGIVALDNNWCYEYLNQRAATMLQQERPEDLIGKNIWEIYPEGVGQPFYRAYYKAVETQEPIIFEQHYEPWNLWFENRVYPSEKGITIYFTEITQRKLQESELRESAALFENTLDAVMISDFDGLIRKVNQGFTNITGYTETEVLQQNTFMLLSKKQNKARHQKIRESLNSKGFWQGEMWHRHKNGSDYPVRVSMTRVKQYGESGDHFLSVFTDISQLRKDKQQLERLAHYDGLTQLPNRMMLSVRLEHGLEVAKRDNRLLALLMLDLDHFKNVNDSFGHAAGDELLQQVAQELSQRFRGSDTVCRLGGDEFTILLEDVSSEADVDQIASELIELLNAPRRLSNKVEVRIGASIGISIYPQDGQDVEALLQHADTALYQAKKDGRDRHRFYHQRLTQKIKEKVLLETRLRHAISNQELRVFYQPQIDLSTMQIVGAEALVRWQDPELGLIFPDSFIEVAESTGLIVELGNWVLHETCRQGKAWLDAGLPRISLAVNLSSQQFLFSDIASVITTTLDATMYPAELLEIELTESALMEREGEAIEIFEQMRTLGLKIAIDDFGTGYSSLAYLKKFPIDVLKIDKSFVDDIPSNEDDKVIASTIIAMAHTLGLKVIAEGVESDAQLQFLKQQKCDFFQGFICSPAVSEAEFEELLSNPKAT